MANIDIHPDKPVVVSHSIHWGAAVAAGVVGGLVFAVLEVLAAPLLLGNSPWVPLHMIGAIALGPGAMASPDTFDLKIVSVAVVVHMALAILYAIILAFIVARMDVGTAALIGALYGLVLYGINFYGFTKWFPWFADHRDWVAIVTHLVQGGLWGWLYKVWATREA